MRVPPYELVDDGHHDIVRTERAAGAGELAKEHHLEEQIAELLAQLIHVAAVDGVHDLARLLDDVAPDRLEGLLAVPGATLGRQQSLHELDQARKRLAALGVENGRFDRWKGPGHTLF